MTALVEDRWYCAHCGADDLLGDQHDRCLVCGCNFVSLTPPDLQLISPCTHCEERLCGKSHDDAYAEGITLMLNYRKGCTA